MTIISQPADPDTSVLEVVEQSHFDVRYIKTRVGLWPFRHDETSVELRNATNFGPNDLFEPFTLREWVDFVEEAPRMIRLEGGGVRVGVLYFTEVEWDFFLCGARWGRFAPPPHAHRRAAS